MQSKVRKRGWRGGVLTILQRYKHCDYQEEKRGAGGGAAVLRVVALKGCEFVK